MLYARCYLGYKRGGEAAGTHLWVGYIIEFRRTIMQYNVAIVGATGLVGQEFIKVLQQRNFPMASISLYASDRSEGKKLYVGHQGIIVRETTPESFHNIDI